MKPKRLAQIGDETSIKLLTLQEDISKSIEVDKILLVSTFNALSTNDSFKLLKEPSGISPIPPKVYLGNAKASDEKAKAELFNEFLSSVYQEEWFKSTPASNDGNCNFYLDELSFSTKYIEALLLKVPESSSLYFKIRCEYYCPLRLYFAYQISYLSYMARPVSWKSTCMTPLHKSVSKADIKNYRGNSILRRISLVTEKMYNFIYEKIRHKLPDSQHGFRSRRSTFTLLLDYVDYLYYFNDENKYLRCVYFVFKKEFDSVSYNRLLFKLEKVGFDKKLVYLISSYLSDRKQHVCISNVLS